MKQARRGLGGWRLAILMVGLVSMVMVALPAQAGLGDLLDDLLDPVEDVPVAGDIVDPIIEGLVDPVVDGEVGPVAGDLVDPIVDEVLAPVVTPIVEAVVTPIVEGAVTPVLDNVVAPAIETIPPVGGTTTTTLPVGTSDQHAPAGESAGFGLSSLGYPGGVLIADTNIDSDVGGFQMTTGLQSLEAALALQTAMVDSGSTGLANPGAVQTQVETIDAGWLDGLTNWLRNGANSLLDLLALPIRLLELLARALLTAGSGLIAPLSMLLAFTAILIKDRGWGRAKG